MRHICDIDSKRELVFDKGSKDNWCLKVLIKDENGKIQEVRCPKDVDYLCFLREQSQKYGQAKIYNDFKAVYDIVHYGGLEGIEYNFPKDCEIIRKMVHKNYLTKKEKRDMFYLYAVLYSTMTAEYYYVQIKDGKKIPSFLKKQIKHLASYQAIFKYDMTIDEIAVFSSGPGKGKLVRKTMKELGIWDENI